MKYFIIFVLGAAIGSLATIVSQPTFSFVVTNLPANTHNTKSDPIVEAPVAVLAPIKKEEEAPVPVVIKEEEAIPVNTLATVEARENASDSLPPLDYTAINERPIFWPSAVKVLVNTAVPLLEKNKKIAELPLNTGDVLQLSKVYGDGKLEVRAKNLKFEIDSKLTNFDILVREKINELAAQGNTTLAPFVRPGENYVPPAKPKLVAPVKNTPPATGKTPNPNETLPVAEPDSPEPAAVIKGQSLDDKMNALFSQGTSSSEKDKTKNKNNKK
jgi:hypothetical protein